jgi:curved DNA-binding protein CbpA
MKMNHNDALHILGLKACHVNADIIKKAYRIACSKYHPDRNPAGLEMMKLVNGAYAALEDVINGAAFDASVKSEHVADSENYGAEINEALNKIITLGLEIEVCGSWIWVSGDTRAHKDTLKEAGFKWAPKKCMWHFRPAGYKSFNRGTWDMDKIRERHGSQVIKNKSFKQLEA